MDIYKDYLNTIEAAIDADSRKVNLGSGYPLNKQGRFQKGQLVKELNAQVPAKQLLPSMREFAATVGLQPDFNQSLGLHPDFSHLKYSEESEEHYIVSMFVDIKGSTNLFKRYDPSTVFIIANTIQRAAIHTCLIFGGYVHRLQGDGLFVYFGRKGMDINKAVERSLQFASVFTYFVKNDIKNLFDTKGIETIFTRIGIDLGYDRDVIWAMAGIGEISEITTCSLHTSLASKMQQHAPSNGVVVGDNILKESPSLVELFAPVCHRTKEENHRYIFEIPEKAFRYTQYDFDWLKFLKKQYFVATDYEGKLRLKTTSDEKPKIAGNLASIALLSKPYFL